MRANLFRSLPILLSVVCAGCATLPSGPPPTGMKFREAYGAAFGGGLHAGLDLDVPVGSPVRAMADGTVMLAEVTNLRGIRTPTVRIRYDEGGYISVYLHIDDIAIKNGDRVKRGDIVAKTAMTGPAGINTTSPVTYPHLHLEIHDSNVGGPIDPLRLQMTCPDQGGPFWYPVGCYGAAKP